MGKDFQRTPLYFIIKWEKGGKGRIERTQKSTNLKGGKGQEHLM